LDNDIILKLATCDLFEDTLTTFNITANQVKILDSFQYKFGKPIKRKRGNKDNKTPQYNIEKALEVTQYLTTLNQNNFDTAIYNIYTELLNYNQITNDKNNTIDQGEASLISYVSYHNQRGSNNYLLTGDKRCLRALISSSFPDILQSLNGKVWCLEQLIFKNIEKFGFEYIKNKIIPVNSCDTALKVAFSSDKVTQENSISALRNYLKNLREETGNLLSDYGE
jgi:hypothetical protein